MTGLQYQFDVFIKTHPEAYDLFERFTFDVINTGRKHFGAKAIAERVRFESLFYEKGGQFKLNNNYVTPLSRMFEFRHPEHKGFFERRKSSFDYVS